MSSSKTKKLRVYEIAKDLKMSSDAVVEMIRQLGVPVRNHMSTVEPDLKDRLRDLMAQEKRAVKEDIARKQHKPEPRTPSAPASRAVVVPPRPKVTPPKPIVTPPEEVVKREVEPPPAPSEEPAPSPSAPAAPPAAESKPAAPSPPAPAAQAPPAAPRAPRPASPKPPARPTTPAAPRPPAPVPPRPSSPGPPSRPAGPPQRPRGPAGPPRRAPGAGSGPRSLERQRPAGGGGRRRDKKKRRQVDERAVAENVRRTLAAMETGRGGRRRRRDREGGESAEAAVETATRVLRVAEFTTVGELAEKMEVKPTEVLAACLKLGLMVNINRRLDRDTIATVADEFDFEVEILSEYGAEQIEEQVPVDESKLAERPPVITVMGHVDHGKTSLLDRIRETDTIGGEAGGITQHIGAYQVVHGGRKLCFLDTPGHEAFTAMRARGAQVTDIVVLVVAADDRVMPQTVEAIDHAKAAGVPLVVAVNKIDVPGANVEMVKQDLTRHHLVVEDFGGDVPVVPVSAKRGSAQNIDQLLEILALQADLLELKADADRPARGVVLEAKVEQGRGVVATVLVQQGTLRSGEAFVAGQSHGKVRAMQNERGQNVEMAGPATPVEVLGWDAVPQAGDTFAVVADEREARELATKRQQLVREHELQRKPHVTLTDLYEKIQEGEVTELKLVIKGDVDGSVEALADSLGSLATDQVKIQVIRQAVGRINESDVQLATASDAIIIGFHVRPEPKARELANRENVDIRLYQVIYEAVEEVKQAMAGLLKPEIEEKVLGSAEVRRVFDITKTGQVAGCMVVAGSIRRNAKVRVIRNQDVIWEGELDSLKRFKDDVREVQSGFECGIKLDGFNEIQDGDLIEAFVLEEVKK